MSYQTQQVDPEAAKEAILEIWRANRPRQTEASQLQEIYRWYYEDNPYGRGSCFLLEKKSEDGQASSAGATGAGRRKFFVDQMPAPVALFGDFFVHRAHRSLFPALMLQRSAGEWAVQNFDFVYGFPNKHAIGVFHRLGFDELGKMTRYVRVLRHEPYLRRLLHAPGPVLSPVGYLLDRAAPFAYPGRWRTFGKGFEVEPLAGFDERFDDLIERARSRFPILGQRTADFLRWRFQQKPDEPCDVYGLFHRVTTGDRLRAYAIVSRTGNVASIRDLIGQSVDDIAFLLPGLCSQLRARGFTSAAFGFFGSDEMVRCLQSNGFQARESERIIIWRRGEHCTIDDAFIRNRNNWHLTDADEDQ